MGYICTRCGGTNVACEAIVNPNNGLPLFKATAVKYGWDNPIGEDSGRERKYDSQY